jgi:hypothetical protein
MLFAMAIANAWIGEAKIQTCSSGGIQDESICCIAIETVDVHVVADGCFGKTNREKKNRIRPCLCSWNMDQGNQESRFSGSFRFPRNARFITRDQEI